MRCKIRSIGLFPIRWYQRNGRYSLDKKEGYEYSIEEVKRFKNMSPYRLVFVWPE